MRLDGVRAGRVVTREPAPEDACIAIVEEANEPFRAEPAPQERGSEADRRLDGEVAA
ncbi:hypothetical protein ACN6LM_003852 [Streptomyces sp. SAS_281]|uniref:hypothetical protein n=1 Tax=Streptomyces sp. SAS_281 TaxID=3412744 RepID=UPI00403CD1F7